jgi:predicted ferric reductase
MWLGLYLAVAVAPLVFALIDETPPGRGFLTDFSVALGFVGLSMMGLQFALVARLQSVCAPFGEDAVVQFHRQMSYVATVFILAHPVLLIVAEGDTIRLFNVFEAPWRARFAVGSVICLLTVVATSIWRGRLRLRYELWQVVHGVLSAAAVLCAVAHIYLVRYYVDTVWKTALWAVMTVAFVGLLAWVRLVTPWQHRRRPWEVERVVLERGDVTTLTLRPVGHAGFDFAPGQFAWIMVDRSPFALTQHPFSFSSSAEADARDEGRLEVSIKALGDFTNTVHGIAPGALVYVDGPHGVFSPDRFEGPGFVLIAGGIGITPLVCMLRTFADRGDRRPCVLLYANRRLDDVTFREELDALQQRLDLRVVHVLENPPDGWPGERGRINDELLHRQLPERFRRMQYFVCGPRPMLDAMEDALARVGVPTDRIHTERYSFV